ncbi:hypothetical protein Ahy_B01g056887 isoform B [Arachis hypogaea]|uniref:Uncharacterized protein n=1 Tax=Arachis hypogaea TaxID=3818 RepID=A0A445AZV6_ARAHY|nr:hypothetical protein Ahy_B01g056887 isoform B [Arachis hypogaea]
MDDHAKLTRQRRKASLSKQRGQLQPYLRSDYRENSSFATSPSHLISVFFLLHNAPL